MLCCDSNTDFRFLFQDFVVRIEKLEVDYHYGWLYFEFEATHNSIFKNNIVQQYWAWLDDRWILFGECVGALKTCTGRGWVAQGYPNLKTFKVQENA